MRWSHVAENENICFTIMYLDTTVMCGRCMYQATDTVKVILACWTQGGGCPCMNHRRVIHLCHFAWFLEKHSQSGWFYSLYTCVKSCQTHCGWCVWVCVCCTSLLVHCTSVLSYFDPPVDLIDQRTILFIQIKNFKSSSNFTLNMNCTFSSRAWLWSTRVKSEPYAAKKNKKTFASLLRAQLLIYCSRDDQSFKQKGAFE